MTQQSKALLLTETATRILAGLLSSGDYTVVRGGATYGGENAKVRQGVVHVAVRLAQELLDAVASADAEPPAAPTSTGEGL